MVFYDKVAKTAFLIAGGGIAVSIVMLIITKDLAWMFVSPATIAGWLGGCNWYAGQTIKKEHQLSSTAHKG